MSEKVVTRFAPSPTGYLHIGGARTALFNWLFARHRKGKFILRIEDTDQRRNTPTATRQVIEDLHWLGIEWDEGPGTEGPNGPYQQSQRKAIYARYIKKLLDEGKAYYCFDSTQELEQLRSRVKAEKKSFIYPRPDKYPSHEEALKKKAEGTGVTVRFALPRKEIIVDDTVRGQIKFGAGEFGDFIIQKSDGFPTYNFACVVDDALMGVSHIIRGQEHLMNTPVQMELWKALFEDIKLPKYAHMSVTISQGGGKLSKRQKPKALLQAIKSNKQIDLVKLAEHCNLTAEALEDFINGQAVPDVPVIDAMAEYLGVHLPEINVIDFLQNGYLPEAMVNFLTLLGWNPGDGREIMSVEELIESFDIERLTKTNSLFDRKKLLSFNTEYIKTISKEKLLEHFKDYIKTINSPVSSDDDELLGTLLEINEGARTLAQIETKCRFLFYENEQIEYQPKAVKKVLLTETGLAMLKLVRDRLAQIQDVTEEKLEAMLRSLAEEKQVGLGKVAQPLRVAITGTTISPPIFNSVKLLGMENVLIRINNTLKKFEKE